MIGRAMMEALRFHPRVDAVLGIARSISPTEQSDVFKCDITDPVQVAHVMREWKPDTIFHLAANPIVKEDETQPFSISHTNILGTHHLLHNAPHGSRFIFASSATVYGQSVCDKWIDEENPTKPDSIYGATKLASEALVNAYSYRLQPLILRLVANVSQHSTHGVVHDFVKKLKSDSQQLEIIGDMPGSRKPFMHVYDTVQAMIWAAQKDWICGTFNLNTSKNIISSEYIADIVMHALGIQKEKYWLGQGVNWRGDTSQVFVNGDKFNHTFSFTPRYTTSEEAIHAAVFPLRDKIHAESIQ